ncbi:MAG: tetratricopeptide repeat protein [Deltaproteobacteria bacterium]|nr:tetratricopeptide repeat protein [Deltaproteobacteria bacterium]
MRARFFGWVAAGMLVAPLASAQPAPAAPTPSGDSKGEAKSEAVKEAEQRFLRGKQLFEEGDYALALVEFNRAYEISPNYRVLFNIAQINIQLFNYAAARTALERYLREGGDDIPAARKVQAEKDLGMLRTRTSYLRITTNPPAAITIDDVPIGTAPFTDALLVNAGQRKIGASALGYISVTKLVTVGGGDSQDVNLVLEAVPADDRPKVTTTTKKNYTPAIIGWVTTGAFTAGAVVFGAIYLSKSSELEEKGQNKSVIYTPEVKSADEAAATRMAVAADVFGLLAIGAAAVSVYFTLKPPMQEAVKVGSVRLTPTPTGVAGTF